MNKSIALVGFMGAGKSSIAKGLSEALGKKLICIDRLIETKEKMSINKIFTAKGESYFRSLEKNIIKELCEEEDLIIDCGGGVVIDKENIIHLKKGILIYLSASPDVIFNRVKNQAHRPLLNVEDPKKEIGRLLEKRKPFYQQAHYTIDTDNLTIAQIIEKIEEIVNNDGD